MGTGWNIDDLSIISNVDFLLEVRKGNVEGHELFTLSSTATGRSNGVESTFWELQGIYTYLVTAQTLYISSTNAGDTTQQIVVDGLDGNYDPITGVATLNGQNQVALVNIEGGGAITFLRVNGAVNPFGTANLLGDVYVAETDTLTAGVPDDSTKIKDFIQISDNIRRSSTYTIKDGFTAFLYNSAFSTRKNDELIVDFMFGTDGGIDIKPTTLNLFQNFAQTPLGYIPIDEHTDFQIRITPQGPGTAASWVGDFILIDNTLLP